MDFGIKFLGLLTVMYLLALLYWVFLKDLMVNGFDLRKFYTRVFKSGDSAFVCNGKVPYFRSCNGNIAIGSVVIFLLGLVCTFLILFPGSEPVVLDNDVPSLFDSFGECNVFDGKWIRDESYPLYNASQCPFAEKGFNCLANGRKDKGYLQWRWRPKNCEIPRFDVQTLLKYLRGKRVVFVGDSLSRTQWESMICMLVSGVEDKRFVYEILGNEITKQSRHLAVRFDSYNFSIEFYRSVYLVLPASVPRRAPKRVKMTIRLDKMDDISGEWSDADVLIFNTGHWWTRTKLFEMGVYFQVGGTLKLGMPVSNAMRKALDTWASWVDSTVNPNRTAVFFRTFESSHWSGRSRKTCKVTPKPMLSTKGGEKSAVSDMIMKVVKKMSVPVRTLHVTPMGAYRSDAHVGVWGDNPLVPDCSHWCLPGVPDMWNEIVFSYLLHKDGIFPQ